MNEQTQYDPWQAAEEAKELPKTYFGQVGLDVWACVLEKGVGKVPFDPNAHKEGQRRTITPLPSANVDFVTERGYVDFARDWASITLPSIKTLGVNLRELHEKWVKYEMVVHGSYVNGVGEEKNLTTPKFLALYQTEEAAEKAAAELYGGGNGDAEPTPASTGDPDPGREVALNFLPTLAKGAGGDPEKMAKVIAANPIIAKYFKIDSPEVVALLVPEEEKVF